MNKKQQLKAMQAELGEISAHIDERVKVANGLKTKIGLLQKQIEIDDRAIEDIVSAHAIVRYLERTLELNIDDLKRQLIANHETTIKNLMTCRITTVNGVLVVKDGVVVTIL